MSDERAAEILRDYAGPQAEEVPTRRIPFEAGWRERQWVRNCVAVGLAGGFLEPLESTGVLMIEAAAGMIAELFPHNGPVDAPARRFNELINARYENIVNFLKLHYCLSRRDRALLARQCRSGLDPRAAARNCSSNGATARPAASISSSISKASPSSTTSTSSTAWSSKPTSRRCASDFPNVTRGGEIVRADPQFRRARDPRSARPPRADRADQCGGGGIGLDLNSRNVMLNLPAPAKAGDPRSMNTVPEKWAKYVFMDPDFHQDDAGEG